MKDLYCLSEQASVVQGLDSASYPLHLTIIVRALMASESIAHEAEARL